MNYERVDRISEEVQRAVDQIIREDVSDPRVQGTFSIVRAEVTRDLRYAKIHISVLEEDKAASMMKALKSAAGFIRRELGKRIIIRYTPELLFVLDKNIAYGAHIASVLQQVNSTSSEGGEQDEQGDMPTHQEG